MTSLDEIKALVNKNKASLLKEISESKEIVFLIKKSL